jgi:hypothetical protein
VNIAGNKLSLQKTSSSAFVCPRCGASFESNRRLSGHMSGKHLRRLGLRNATISLSRLTQIQIGYLAAFPDGEGGIPITRNFRRGRANALALHPTVYFTNTNRKALSTIHEWLGCGCLTRRIEKPPHRDTFVPSVTGTRNVLMLLKVLRPYLIIKKHRADIMISYCRSRLSHYRSGGRRFNPLELRLYTQLHRLNKKGGKSRSHARIAD